MYQAFGRAIARLFRPSRKPLSISGLNEARPERGGRKVRVGLPGLVEVEALPGREAGVDELVAFLAA